MNNNASADATIAEFVRLLSQYSEYLSDSTYYMYDDIDRSFRKSEELSDKAGDVAEEMTNLLRRVSAQ